MVNHQDTKAPSDYPFWHPQSGFVGGLMCGGIITIVVGLVKVLLEHTK